MVDPVVAVVTLQANERAMFIGDDRFAGFHVLADHGLNSADAKVWRDASAKFAALLAACALPSMIVLLLAADEVFIGLDFAVEGAVERLGFDRVAQPVSHEPSGLLCDTDILSQLRAGDAFLMRGNQPDRQHPRAQRDFAILENGAHLDREALAALAALVGALIRKVIDLGRLAVRAERAVFPADRCELVNRGLPVGRPGHQLKDGIELLHGGFLAHAARLALSPNWVQSCLQVSESIDSRPWAIEAASSSFSPF